MRDEREQDLGREAQDVAKDDEQDVPAPTTAIADLEPGEQAEDVKGGGFFL